MPAPCQRREGENWVAWGLAFGGEGVAQSIDEALCPQARQQSASLRFGFLCGRLRTGDGGQLELGKSRP